jgi:hypothetical protein
MDTNGQVRNAAANEHVLRWSGRVLTAEDLRRSLNGHREVVLTPRTIVTPLAAEQLRAEGVRLILQERQEQPAAKSAWGFAQDRPHPLVRSAVRAVERNGLRMRELPPNGQEMPCRWAKAVAECVASGECWGGVIFCQDPGLVCCVANKVAGLRAVPVATVAQAARAALTLGANLVAVEMPGRTFFEVRQILCTICNRDAPACPAGAACTLQELDGHAHR